MKRNEECHTFMDIDGKDVLKIECPSDENIKLIVNGKEITCTS